MMPLTTQTQIIETLRHAWLLNIKWLACSGIQLIRLKLHPVCLSHNVIRYRVTYLHSTSTNTISNETRTAMSSSKLPHPLQGHPQQSRGCVLIQRLADPATLRPGSSWFQETGGNGVWVLELVLSPTTVRATAKPLLAAIKGSCSRHTG